MQGHEFCIIWYKQFIMRSYLKLFLLLFTASLLLSSCEAIGDIFKAGVWFGVIGVVLVVGLILYFVGKKK